MLKRRLQWLFQADGGAGWKRTCNGKMGETHKPRQSVAQWRLRERAGVYGCGVLTVLELRTSSITSVWQLVSFVGAVRTNEVTTQTIQPASDVGRQVERTQGCLKKNAHFASLELFRRKGNLTWVTDGQREPV